MDGSSSKIKKKACHSCRGMLLERKAIYLPISALLNRDTSGQFDACKQAGYGTDGRHACKRDNETDQSILQFMKQPVCNVEIQ